MLFELMCNSAQLSKTERRKAAALFCQWGNGGDASPTAAPSGCGFGLLKRETWSFLEGKYNLRKTLVQCKWTLVQWVGKENTNPPT